MRKLKMTFPNGFVAHATILTDREPKCSEDMWEFFKVPKRLICHHTISTGNVIVCHDRPPRHPVPSGSQIAPLGEHPLHYTCIQAGNIVWKGWAINVAYGPSTEPASTGGPLIATVDEDCFKGFLDACKDVWYHTYLYHKLAVLTVEREEA